MLPSREIAAHRDDAADLVAFNAEQPPPLTIERPAAAVAVLHATIPNPEQAQVSAAPTKSVQPPRMFRPIVLPPPITGHTPSPSINLAPTLSGPPSADPGMISLAPAPVAESPAPLKFAVPPTAAPVPKTLEPIAPQPPAAPPTAKPTIPALPLAAPREAALPLVPERPALAKSEPQMPSLPLPSPAVAPAPRESTVPALAISRLDQHSLQSLFMTDETLDLSKIARLAAALPGIEASIIATRDESVVGGNIPPGFELAALRSLAPQIGAAADRLPIGELKNFTLFGAAYSVSFFERGAVCLSVVHRARSFVPGVREKLVAVTEELAR